MRWRPPEPEFAPDARRPRITSKQLRRYTGMPVEVIYRPKTRDPRDPGEVALRGVAYGTVNNPPRFVLLINGRYVKLPLDRVAYVTLDAS